MSGSLFQQIVDANDREIEARRQVREFCQHGRRPYETCMACELEAMRIVREMRMFEILAGLARAVEALAAKL